MKKRIALWFLLVFVTALGLYGAESLVLQRQLADKTLRLHVVANSDSQADQAQKLRVRDAVLEKTQELTATCTSAQEARRLLARALPQIEAAACAVLKEEGSAYGISVSLEETYFDTRYYDTFTLPAGSYPSLRVRIGEAKGENWWCVVFPSLCLAATSDEFQEAAQTGGLTQRESDFIEEGEQSYTLRFKTLEWIKKLSDLFNVC